MVQATRAVSSTRIQILHIELAFPRTWLLPQIIGSTVWSHDDTAYMFMLSHPLMVYAPDLYSCLLVFHSSIDRGWTMARLQSVAKNGRRQATCSFSPRALMC